MVVSDPDAAFQRAVNAGAKVIVAMENNYGWRLGRVLDCFRLHALIAVRDDFVERVAVVD